VRNEKLYKSLIEKHEGKRSFGIPRCRRKNKIKINLRTMELETVDFIDLAQDRDLYRLL
jgi:hypothetical protein